MTVKKLGVIDVGSHSVHCEIFDRRGQGEPRSLYSKSEPSHMGRIVGEKGRVPQSLLHHLKTAISAFCKKARKKGADVIIIGATAGFRKASNGEAAIRQIERWVGCPIYLLNPERESELGFMGIESELQPGLNHLFVDCGGGSTEVSLARGRHRIAHATLPFGSSLLSLKIRNDPPEVTDIAQLIFPWAEGSRLLPRALQPERALVSGGTIADLMTLLSEKTPETVTLEHMNTAVRIVLRKKFKKIARKYNLAVEDTWNLLPGAFTLTCLLTTYGLERAMYTQKSVRDGMARAYQKKGAHWWKADSSRQFLHQSHRIIVSHHT